MVAHGDAQLWTKSHLSNYAGLRAGLGVLADLTLPPVRVVFAHQTRLNSVQELSSRLQSKPAAESQSQSVEAEESPAAGIRRHLLARLA
jgi:hypothetical protein